MPRVVTVTKARPYDIPNARPQYRLYFPRKVADLFNWSGEITFELEATSGKIVLRAVSE